ncbi:MAG: hypothetical protein C0444_09675 [Microbacterium sp.]|nr:hypothetical protein [Microbacterium sp.]MBA4345076.1 hypothetical protein [Microbacterium sp.]
MEFRNYLLYNEGDIKKGLRGPVTQVLLALNELDGNLFENMMAIRTGLPVKYVREVIVELMDEGLFKPEPSPHEMSTEDDGSFEDLLRDV